MHRSAPARALVSILSATLVVLGSATAFTLAGPASPAVAAANLDCGTLYSIQGQGQRNVRSVDPATGTMTNVGRFNIPGVDAALNGLGLTNDGSKAYGVLPADSGNGRSIYVYDRATETTTRLGAGVSGSPVTHGAVNPQTGIYYYGGFSGTVSGGTGTLRVYGFNPATGQSLGLVAQGRIPAGGANGDWAFDQQGNLFVVGGIERDNRVAVINQALPTTPVGSPLAITGTQLVTSNANSAINGIAFGGDGFLYLTSGSTLFRVNPSTGAVVDTRSLSQSGSVDLASCASPNTIKVVKDFPNGRVNPGEQATVSVTGGGITSGNTGTTEGNDSGLQDQPGEYAGPVLALSGNTYTVSETGAATQSPNYVRSYVCVDENTGNTLTSGNGTTGSFTMPPGGTEGVAAVCTFTNVAQIPDIELDKQVTAKSGNNVGDTITYSFVVTNTGNVPLDPVTVDDPLLGTVTCPPGVLAPGADRTCTAEPYTLTQDDVDNGQVDNTAVATGTPTTPGLPTVEDDDSTSTPIDQDPSLALVKEAGDPVDANGSGLTDAGDTVQYTFTVTNDGNVVVRNLRINDPLAGSVTCEQTTLQPGASTTCVADAVYTITDADEEAGEVVNTARAIGTGPDGDVPSNEDSTTTPVEQPDPALSIDKRAGDPVDVNNSGITDAGDTIDFTFTVTNTGNVPLTEINVNDPKVGAVTCEATSLAPGESTECAADEPYVITETDEEGGAVVNTALAEGTDPDGGDVTSPPDSTRTPVELPEPKLVLDKVAGEPVDVNESGITDAGDTIQFTFTVTNEGNVPISNIVVSDPLAGAVTCEATSLAPGESTQCAADEVYVITAEDEQAEVVRNTATAEGEDPDGDPVPSDPDSTNTPTTPQAPAITLEKFAGEPVDVNESGITDAGDTIQFTFTVTNDGNVPVFDVTVDDPIAGSVTCPPGRLAVGESVECAADAPYVVTEADEDAGEVVNVATASATDPDEDPVESNEDTTTTPVTKPNPSLAIDKTAGTPVDVNDSGITDAGDTIEFTFLVTNTGNVPLHAVSVTDPMVGAVDCPKATLAPGESMQCTAEPYVITEDDEASGSVVNTAIAEGEDPDGEPVDPPEDSTETPIPAEPELDLVKKAELDDKDGDDRADVGETIRWTFEVTNTGNVTLEDIEVDDPKAGSVTCEVTTLAPGESVECVADEAYVVTQADVDSGVVHNVATATGTPPTGDPVDSPESETETPTDSRTALALVKDSKLIDRNDDGDGDPGEKIRYTFTVTNTGTVTVSGISIDDDMLSEAGVEITCKATELAPGEKTTCSAVYTITKADMSGDEIVNVATANGCAGSAADDGAQDRQRAETCDPVTSNEDDTSTPVDDGDKGDPKDPDDPGNGDPDDGDDPVLPNTGGPMGLLLWLGLAMLLGGGGFMAWSRRKQV